MVSRAPLVCLVPLDLRDHLEKTVTRSADHPHANACFIVPVRSNFRSRTQSEPQYLKCCASFMQGEVGEPGQKGSKADKGEQVCYWVAMPNIHDYSFLLNHDQVIQELI